METPFGPGALFFAISLTAVVSSSRESGACRSCMECGDKLGLRILNTSPLALTTSGSASLLP